jgi:predicted amidophosphoribosyltransferase
MNKTFEVVQIEQFNAVRPDYLICQNCDARIEPTDLFCSNCGSRV